MLARIAALARSRQVRVVDSTESPYAPNRKPSESEIPWPTFASVNEVCYSNSDAELYDGTRITQCADWHAYYALVDWYYHSLWYNAMHFRTEMIRVLGCSKARAKLSQLGEEMLLQLIPRDARIYDSI